MRDNHSADVIQRVCDIKDNDFIFISDSQDVEPIISYFPEIKDDNYDSFFVKIGGGDYISVYGMYGIIPHLDKRLYKVL